jgi:hypothetical protein
MPESNTKKYQRDTGESLYRRSLYTFWKRAAPPALMDILNAPSRETCAVRRERTNTPLQALATLNDPQFVEAARKLAEIALQKSGDDPEKAITYMSDRVLLRPLRDEERKSSRRPMQTLNATSRHAPTPPNNSLRWVNRNPTRHFHQTNSPPSLWSQIKSSASTKH